MTNVIDFYCNDGRDPYGRSLSDMIKMTDYQLESSHDVIQWLFPLHEASNFNSECPILDEESVQVLRNNHEAQKRMYEVILRFVRFLGFDYVMPSINGSDDKFDHDPMLAKNRQNWRTKGNHNHLRITRAIRSMRLFGLEKDAKMFFDAVYRSAVDAGCISENNVRYWKMALEEDVFETLRK